MKKMRLFMLLALVLVCLSGLASAHSWDWVLSTDTVGVYYSRGSAVRLSDNRQAGETGHIKAWFKHQYEDENERQEQATILQKYSDKDTSNFYYEVAQDEYMKKNGTVYSRTLNFYSYDYYGNQLFADNDIGEWKVVIPSSNGMKLYERALADAR